MRENKISRTQLMCLLWAGVMAPAAEMLPALLSTGAGKGAWLSVLLSAPLVLAAGEQGPRAMEVMGDPGRLGGP